MEILTLILTLVLIVITGVYAYFTFRICKANEEAVTSIRKQTYLQATLAVLDDLGSEKNRSLRRFIYNNLPKEFPFPAEAFKIVEQVCNSFERTGLLVNKELVDSDLVMAMYYDTIGKCWNQLCPWIENEIPARGHLYMIEFRKLDHLAKGYFKKLGGGEELPRIFKYPGNVMEGLSPVEEPGTAGDIKNCIKTSQP